MGISLFYECASENYTWESNDTVKVGKNQDPTLCSCRYSKSAAWVGDVLDVVDRLHVANNKAVPNLLAPNKLLKYV
jgi:hypothetical protein